MTHINSKGEFQSDKYVIFHTASYHNSKTCYCEMSSNKVVLSFNDLEARVALACFAHLTKDRELGEDILEVLKKYEKTD